MRGVRFDPSLILGLSPPPPPPYPQVGELSVPRPLPSFVLGQPPLHTAGPALDLEVGYGPRGPMSSLQRQSQASVETA